MAVWPPSVDADGPRAAGVVGPGVERVVAALAGGVADGVDRREVHDVEAHGRHRGEACDGAPEAALRAREQLVPGAHERPLAVDPQRVRLGGGVVGGDRVARDPCLHDQLVAAQVGGLDDRLPAVDPGRDERHRLVPPFAVADGRQRTRAPRGSWPSLKTVAPTVTASPITALAG